MTVKKKSAFSHPELSLLPLCRIVSQGGRDKEIDAYCQSVGAKDWWELFAKYPTFNPTAIANMASSNHPALNSAVGLCHSSTRKEAISSWTRAAEMESSSVGFELNEPGSRIYKIWSLIARLIGYRELGPEWRDRYFEKWLRMYIVVELLSSIPLHDGPFSLRPGTRSQGVFDRTKSDYFISKVARRNWTWRSKPHPLPDRAWAKSDEIMCMDNLYEIYKDLIPGDLYGENAEQDLLRLCPSWPTLNPTHFYATSIGLAVWCERADLNSNTPGISAMVYEMRSNDIQEGGYIRGLTTAPSPSRDHLRQKKVPQMVEYLKDAGVLHFEQLHPGRKEKFDIPLPSGELVYHIYHGANGLEVIS